MFKKELQQTMSKIFGMSKTVFDSPSESFEQDTLFIEVSEATHRVSQGRSYAKVQGSIVVFSQNDKMPFGFFAKRISLANKDLTSKLFFFDVDTEVLSSPARIQNLNERRARFIYLYSGEFDPNQGALNEVDFGG